MESSRKRAKSKSEQISELQTQLSEALANLDAIRSGEADAIVVHTDSGVSVFTIQGSESAYRIMVDTMNEGAFSTDSEGIILYVNARFCTMLNLPYSSIIGKPVQTFIAENQVPDFELFLKKTVAGNNVHRDFDLTKRDFSLLPVYFSSAPLEIVGRHDICIITSDLTERSIARRKLIELNSSLEMKVAARTRELEEQKGALEKSQAQLQKLTVSLEQQVDHRTAQVRNLAKALTLAEQKQRQHLSVILHEDLQQVLFSTKARFRLLKESIRNGCSDNLEQDLKDLEALTSKALGTTKQLAIEFNPPVLASEGLDAALKWLAHHIEQQYGLKVQVKISERFRIIREDERVLLVQLVRELLMNIVKHAGTGIAYLTVSRDEKHIFIEVEDRGSGFEMEKEIGSARDKTHMGIFSIKERLQLFGGNLQIDTTPGKGTKILMTLPFDPEIQQLSVE